MSFLTANYLMKYSTDILQISPGAMGVIFLVSRFWDAINDPLCGYLSDHTQSRLGRRKVWILFSSLPIAVFFVMMWQSPEFLSERGKIFWMAVSVLVFFTAITALYIPHYSLGAELSEDFNEHSKIFGWRAVFENMGNFLGVAVMIFLTSSLDTKKDAVYIMSVIAAAAIFLPVFMVYSLKGGETVKNKVKSNFMGEFKSVFKNVHAKIVLLTGFFTQSAAVFIMGSSLYYAQYVLKNKETGNYIIAVFMISATIFIPLWVKISKKFGKKNIFVFSQIILSVGFFLLFFLSFMPVEFILLLSAVMGFFGGCVLVIHPSMLADTINYDAHKTGENKEGIYFSFFTFINKTAMALAAFLILVTLEFSGFIPNVEQTAGAALAIRALFCLAPAVLFLAGALVLRSYRLVREEYQNKVIET